MRTLGAIYRHHPVRKGVDAGEGRSDPKHVMARQVRKGLLNDGACAGSVRTQQDFVPSQHRAQAAHRNGDAGQNEQAVSSVPKAAPSAYARAGGGIRKGACGLPGKPAARCTRARERWVRAHLPQLVTLTDVPFQPVAPGHRSWKSTSDSQTPGGDGGRGGEGCGTALVICTSFTPK